MSSIQLHFADAKHPELHRVLLSHPLLDDSILSVRGKTAGAFKGSASFQWTSGVKAFSLLVIKTAAQLNFAAAEASLDGDLGTAAVALDNTLGKLPTWIVEMFGCDSQGQPLAKRLFRRTNPNRKVKGPVGVSLNLASWQPLSISIWLDGTQLEQAIELTFLAESLEQHFASRIAVFECNGEHSKAELRLPKARQLVSLSEPQWKERLKRVMVDEVQLGIHATEIFNRGSLRTTVKAISENESFRNVAGSNKPIISDLDLSLSPSDRLGVVEHEQQFRKLLCPDEPFLISCPSPIPASLALFLYLRDVKGYHLELDYSDAHTVETARKIVRREFLRQPDFSVLAIAPAATVLGNGEQNEYEPIMMLPRLSQGIIGPKGAQAANAGRSQEFVFVGDAPSISSFLYEELVRSDHVDTKQSQTRHVENDEAFRFLQEADLNTRAILFFPFYQINSWVNACELLPDPRPKANLQETVLFGHRSVTSNKPLLRCLDVAIRDAWLELKTNPELIERLVDRLLDEPEYLKILGRHAGLYNGGSSSTTQ